MASLDRKGLLAQYREPHVGKSAWQLASTTALFCGMWCLMWYSLQYSYAVTLCLSLPAAGLLVRLFILQHDCGHGSFFKSKRANDIVGSLLGVLVLTPYAYWRRQHALHHATSGDLDRRGFGDVRTITVNEYLALSAFQKLVYRVHRNPLVFFGVAPIIYFGIFQRFTAPLPRHWKAERAGVHLTNLGLAATMAAAAYIVGWQAFLMVHLPIVIIASSAGAWLFYVQHNFDPTYWERHENWNFETAAVEGSSYYHLPKSLQWFTANIGFHHIHHLDSRIPNYRLQECYEQNSEFQPLHRLTLWQSLSCASLKLWDEDAGRMVGFQGLKDRRHAA